MATSNIVPCDADIECLSSRKDSKLRGTICMSGRMPRPQCVPLPRLSNPSSSLGLLGRLPLELMLETLRYLDFQSITRFAEVSVLANGYVRSCREYRDVLTLVPETVQALRRLGVLSLHSVAAIYHALRADACATCGEAGAFLFLPTCQRCCIWCRRYYPSLRLMTRAQAKKYYGLTKQQTDQLRTVHVRNAMVYRPNDMHYPAIHGRSVAAQAARDLSLAVHGSEEAVHKAVLAGCASSEARDAGCYWTRAHLLRPRDDWYVESLGSAPTPSGLLNREQADHATMAAMHFPTLTDNDGTLEYALWCRGCEKTKVRLWIGRMLDHGAQERLRALLPPEYRTAEYHPNRVGLGLSDRAWWKESFLQHARHCPGAQALLREKYAQ
ncbi:uncharacterized protein PG986_002278 [Apiospora aurea]|uniref:F-box domain-containing protein n=1 Tax=Apiospora aurea TaxID=335848 RepID=A0ABR1QZ61_9PEZI